MMVMKQPFSIIMTGTGIVALAGIVVNNNIVLIDTYDRLRHEGWKKKEAIKAIPILVRRETDRRAHKRNP